MPQKYQIIRGSDGAILRSGFCQFALEAGETVTEFVEAPKSEAEERAVKAKAISDATAPLLAKLKAETITHADLVKLLKLERSL